MDVDPAAVDDYLRRTVIEEPVALSQGRKASHRAGLPAIEVSAGQGKLLELLARLSGARRVLEIGTLGGYSTSWLAAGVGPAGHVTTCEFEPRHAEVARVNLDAAGVGDRVDIRLGAARDTLAALRQEEVAPFDLVFIDADKINNDTYFELVLPQVRPGGFLLIDNVLWNGKVLPGYPVKPADKDTHAVRAFNAKVQADARVENVLLPLRDGLLLVRKL